MPFWGWTMDRPDIEGIRKQLNGTWQGLGSVLSESLLAYITDLERERDEALKRVENVSAGVVITQRVLSESLAENRHLEQERDEAQEAFRNTSDHADAVSAQLEQAQRERDEARRLLREWESYDGSDGAPSSLTDATRAFLGVDDADPRWDRGAAETWQRIPDESYW